MSKRNIPALLMRASAYPQNPLPYPKGGDCPMPPTDGISNSHADEIHEAITYACARAALRDFLSDAIDATGAFAWHDDTGTCLRESSADFDAWWAELRADDCDLPDTAARSTLNALAQGIADQMDREGREYTPLRCGVTSRRISARSCSATAPPSPTTPSAAGYGTPPAPWSNTIWMEGCPTRRWRNGRTSWPVGQSNSVRRSGGAGGPVAGGLTVTR